jgi:hypothetical protein
MTVMLKTLEDPFVGMRMYQMDAAVRKGGRSG